MIGSDHDYPFPKQSCCLEVSLTFSDSVRILYLHTNPHEIQYFVNTWLMFQWIAYRAGLQQERQKYFFYHIGFSLKYSDINVRLL